MTARAAVRDTSALVERLRRVGDAWINSGAPLHELLKSAAETIEQLREVAPSCLCGVCGTVTFARDWTYWQRDDEGGWRESRWGEGDPMARCPACQWEHQDTDDGSGFYEGTVAEMEAQRVEDAPDQAEWWAERLAEVAS